MFKHAGADVIDALPTGGEMDNEEWNRHVRREVLRKLAAVGALGAAGFHALVRDALAADARPGIRVIKGKVTVDGQPASVGQPIEPGQTVETDRGSQAIFVVGKDAYLQRENTSLDFEGSRTVAVMRVVTGKILGVFGKGRKEIHTPTATIGIRGTGCYIEAEDVRTYFCLCYGKAVLTPDADPRAETSLNTMHHERPLYVGTGQAAQVVASAPVINHSDAELIMLEGLVGRKPAFWGKGYKPY
jgi:hypothetical protein